MSHLTTENTQDRPIFTCKNKTSNLSLDALVIQDINQGPSNSEWDFDSFFDVNIYLEVPLDTIQIRFIIV